MLCAKRRLVGEWLCQIDEISVFRLFDGQLESGFVVNGLEIYHCKPDLAPLGKLVCVIAGTLTKEWKIRWGCFKGVTSLQRQK